MTKEDKRARILPALDLAIQEAERRGVISDLDLAGIAMAYNLAGYLDNASLSATEIAKLTGQLQTVLDKYGLSLFGRKEKPEFEAGDDPLEQIRDQKEKPKLVWEDRTQITDFTNPDKPN